MSPRTPLSGCLLLTLCSTLWLAPREGQAAVKPARPAPAAAKVTDAGPDPAEALLAEVRKGGAAALEAAQRLAALATARALELSLDELALGPPPPVAGELLSGLVGRKDPKAIEVLVFYAHHRSPDLRKRAVQALGEIPDERVVPVLIDALSDPTTDVRATAAAALGARRERRAEGALLKLLQHKDTAAPAALGLIGGPDTARTLSEMVGNVPDRLVVQTLGELLKRADFGPDALRVEVVKTLGKIPGNDPVDALSEYLKLSAKDKARPSRTEATKIVEQRTAK